MADEKSLNETRHLLMQTVEHINELENSRMPTPPPRSSSGARPSLGCTTYRPITHKVQVHDTRNISFSLNHSTSPCCGRADKQNLSRRSHPGPLQSSNHFLLGFCKLALAFLAPVSDTRTSFSVSFVNWVDSGKWQHCAWKTAKSEENGYMAEKLVPS